MKTFTKSLATLTLVLSLTFGINQQAHSLVAISSIAGVTTTALYETLLFGAGLSFSVANYQYPGQNNSIASSFFWIFLLDKNSNSFKLNSLTEEDAQKFDLTHDELVAYNDELEQINLASEGLNLIPQNERLLSLQTALSENALNALTKIICH